MAKKSRKTTRKTTPKRRTTKTKKAKVAKAAKKAAPQPKWDLERDGITQTAIASWQVCPEQFSLRYIEGMVPKRFNEPIIFGSLFHACIEHRGKLPPLEAMNSFREHTRASHANDQEYMTCFDHLMYKVAALFPVYEKTYPHKAEARCVNAEKPFAIPIIIDGLRFHVRGKRDRELAAKGGKLALQEIKTRSKIDIEKIRHALRADMQTLIYLWSMWKESGKVPAYLLYDVIKRPQLKVTRETLPQHYERIAQHATDKPHDYFARWRVEDITENDLQRFENEILMPVLRAFVRWWLEVKKNPFQRFDASLHHLNLNALSNPWGDSDYYDLLILGKRENYFVLSSPHPELSE